MNNQTPHKKRMGITMGDAAGVGPEVIVKALSRPDVYDMCQPLVIGDVHVLERAAKVVRFSGAIQPIDHPHEGRYEYGYIDCLDTGAITDAAHVPFGEQSATAGNAAFMYVAKALNLAQEKQIQTICTAPLNKEALHMAGHMYPGHTEILAELTQTTEFSMMLAAPGLKVIYLTTHVGLLKAIEMIDPERTYTVIKLAHEVLTRSGVSQPKIAVCGINPHAGENGLFGNGEEENKLNSGIENAQEDGIDASGPFPADTLFYRARRGDFI